MKYILSLLVALSLMTSLSAQTNADKVAEINFYTTEMDLGNVQVGQTAKVIHSKYSAYDSFKDLKTTDPDLYAAKLKSTYDMTIDKMEAIMTTLRQIEYFAFYRTTLQADWATQMQEYQAQGMSVEEANNQYYETVFFP